MLINSIRQKTVVGKEEKIDVLVEAEKQEATAYLLSTEANRTHLFQSLQDLDDPTRYIYAELAEL